MLGVSTCSGTTRPCHAKLFGMAGSDESVTMTYVLHFRVEPHAHTDPQHFIILRNESCWAKTVVVLFMTRNQYYQLMIYHDE